MKPVLNYHGGKHKLAPKIIKLFPSHECYCEPYAGGASVLIQKPLSKIEVYNDADASVVNFFKVLRENPDQLISQILLTPWSRQELHISYDLPTEDPIEWARRFYVFSWQSYRLVADNSWRIRKKRNREYFPEQWQRVEHLLDIAERLLYVQIEHDNALTCFSRYDSPDTLFYVDPPYLPATRYHPQNYTHDMTYEDHVELLDHLAALKGMIVLSGYQNDLYSHRLTNWTRHDFKVGSKGKGQTESVWLSPTCQKRGLQMRMEF